MKCYIFGAGEYFSEKVTVSDDDFVIAADGGYNYTLKEGIIPDIILGDFDSLKDIPKGANVLTYPKEKDETDTLIAIREGLEKGCTQFHIYGGTGGRFDHTIANIQCVAMLSKKQIKAYLYGEKYVLTAITNSKIEFSEDEQGYISVFSFSEKALGVNEEGLKYSLKDATIMNDDPVGVSNEFCGKQSKISVKEGTLIIVKSLDNKSGM